MVPVKWRWVPFFLEFTIPSDLLNVIHTTSDVKKNSDAQLTNTDKTLYFRIGYDSQFSPVPKSPDQSQPDAVDSPISHLLQMQCKSNESYGPLTSWNPYERAHTYKARQFCKKVKNAGMSRSERQNQTTRRHCPSEPSWNHTRKRREKKKSVSFSDTISPTRFREKYFQDNQMDRENQVRIVDSSQLEIESRKRSIAPRDRCDSVKRFKNTSWGSK